MKEELKQFSAELLKDFQSALLKNQSTVSQIKAAEDGGTFKVIISTSDEDRQGDMIDQSKWKLDNYEKNPVVLWAHDYSTPPIGICTGISLQNGKLVAEGKFAPSELNSFAGEIAGLYDAGYINTTSVGYIQHEDGELELLEFSFVPVPANPFALSIRDTKNMKLNMAELVMKGLSFVTKGPVPYKSHGIVDDTDSEWDGPAQVKACGDDLDKLKSICAWFDGENADKKSAYKLPHHEAESLKANWRGVAAAMGALMGSRGGVKIPEGDKKAVFQHLAKHYKEFGKEAPDYEKAVELFDILKKSPELMHPMNKSPQVGDTCELDDGTPGVLADNPKDPGQMICVPERDKSQKEETDMNNELTKNLKAEDERHGKAVAKHIDEFETKAAADEEGATEGKAHKEDEGNDNSEHEKAIDEFKDALDEEHSEHLKKVVKAIDDTYETMGREPNKDEKAINEFKSEMKAEHLKHVKAFHKAIDEFKADHAEADGADEREQAFTKCEKAMAVELDRHEKAHMEMAKAEMGEGEDDGKSEEEKALEEFVAKAGRAISAKNKEKLKAILEKMESHHNDVTAAIKELMGSEDGDGGEEPSKKPKDDESDDEKALKQGRAPQGATAELDVYLFTQRIVRQVNSASEGALRQIKEKIKEARSQGK